MTPQERKVIELALEALGTMDVFNPNRMEAITALRQAIAEAEKQDNFCDNNCVWTDHHPDCKLSQQEPEWYHIIDVHGCNRFYHKTEERSYMSGQITPLYTTPPQPVVNQSLTTEPVALQMDVIVVNLVREGINKHRARELAEHFIKHTTPPQRKPLTSAVNDEMLAALEWITTYIENAPQQLTEAHQWAKISRGIIEAAHGIKE